MLQAAEKQVGGGCPLGAGVGRVRLQCRVPGGGAGWGCRSFLRCGGRH